VRYLEFDDTTDKALGLYRRGYRKEANAILNRRRRIRKVIRPVLNMVNGVLRFIYKIKDK